MKVVLVATRMDILVIGVTLSLTVVGIILGIIGHPFLASIIISITCLMYLAFALRQYSKWKASHDL